MSAGQFTPVLEVPLIARARRPRQLRLVRHRAVPVVKWAGGKARLLDKILPHLPSCARYLEPFCGGAAVFFALAPSSAVISDTCVPLIELYQELARDPVEVRRWLDRLLERSRGDSLAIYYDTRAAWNSSGASWDPAQRAAVFLYLNKSCFNGLWRVNSSGEFNVPIGKFASGPSYPMLADLVAAGAALRRAEVLCEDYAGVFDRAVPGDLVYVDPPYVPRNETSSFTGYTVGGFDESAQRDLAKRVLALVERGVRVVASQSDTPLVREIYQGLSVHELSAPRSVGAAVASRGAVPELLLIGGPS